VYTYSAARRRGPKVRGAAAARAQHGKHEAVARATGRRGYGDGRGAACKRGCREGACDVCMCMYVYVHANMADKDMCVCVDAINVIAHKHYCMYVRTRKFILRHTAHVRMCSAGETHC
jgi:hypothetical protein